MTKNTLAAALVLVLLTSTAFAQEAITLTSPIARPSISSYTPVSLYLTVAPVAYIRVVIATADGVDAVFEYPCAAPCANSTAAQVTALITALNTANLTTRSLWRRVFDRLVLDFPTRFPGGATVQ